MSGIHISPRNVVFIPFTFTNGDTKNRPALIISSVFTISNSNICTIVPITTSSAQTNPYKLPIHQRDFESHRVCLCISKLHCVSSGHGISHTHQRTD